MADYLSSKIMEFHLTVKIDDEKYKSILYTDGVEDFWISRKYHTREYIRDSDFTVFIEEWLAYKIGLIE